MANNFLIIHQYFYLENQIKELQNRHVFASGILKLLNKIN